ncbi:MAG: radical SAM protein [Pseudomonadota bacterium]
MVYIFGPVPSRRLGLSLGVDLIPAKTCTYDCLYCQVGRTTCKTVETGPYVPIQDVLNELERKLEQKKPDTVTLAGSGEPTLHSRIDRVISFIKDRTDTKIAVLTNGSLLWKEEVRSRVSGAHILMPTLTTAFPETYSAIHRPHADLKLNMIIEGYKRLRQTYRGLLFLEVVLLAGYNDSEREIEELRRVINPISPDRIQLNTVVRPPADSMAKALDSERLEEIKNLLGPRAEIIAEAPFKKREGQSEYLATTVLEMAKRRPLRAVDVANALNIGLDETEGLIKGLLIKGAVSRQEHSGEVYYLLKD